jgi:hypothetical protein
MPDFLEELNAIRDTAPASLSALDAVRDFVDNVRQFADGRFECKLEEGFIVSLGKEWRVVLEKTSGQVPYTQTLLRAYIPVGNYPAHLDFYDPMQPLRTVHNDAEMEAALREFLRRPGIKELLATMYGPTGE